MSCEFSSSGEIKLPEQYSGKCEGSFGYLHIKETSPVIIEKVVNFLCSKHDEIAASYGEFIAEEIIERLSALQNEVITNKQMKAIQDDDEDAVLWNKYLQIQEILYTFPPSWFDSSLLFSQCYFYRKIREAFLLGSTLKDYDPFQNQKEESFLSTMELVSVLCSALNDTLAILKNCNNDSEKFVHFKRYLQIAMWSNKWDLCTSAETSHVVKSNPFSKLDELQANIIINQTNEIYQKLQDINKLKKNITVDYVLDNAGFELFCDLCLLQFLSSSGLVKKINIYPKSVPWFVSDTLEKDIYWLLQACSKSNHENLVKFSEDCFFWIQSGVWLVQNEKFWTLPHDYSEMQSADPELYKKLAKSDLIIFKGDLNYRKLIGDRQWEGTTTFKEALNGFLPSSLVSLRNIKSDAIVGLKPGTDESLSKLSKNWKYSGDYAIIQSYLKNI